MITKIAIAEDNFLLAKSVQERLSFYDEFKIKFLSVNGKDLIEKLEKDPNVDLILMDIEMPKMNGIEATQFVKKRYPQIKILILTVFDNDANIFNAIKAGADGYLLKETSPQELKKSILEVLEGGAAMSPSIAFKTLKLLRNPQDFENRKCDEDIKLSTREIEVLEQLSRGLNYNIIAINLFLSPSTIRKHIENIYTKLQVHNKLEAIEKAKSNRII